MSRAERLTLGALVGVHVTTMLAGITALAVTRW